MSECSAPEKRFVYALATGLAENYAQACVMAGYSVGKPGSSQIRVRAAALTSRPRVIAAIRETAAVELQSLIGLAVRAQKNMLLDSKHPSHERAVASTLNRTGLAERQAVDVTIDGIVKVVDHRAAALEDYRRAKELGLDQSALEKLFGYSGMSLLEQQLGSQPKVIEHIPAETEETTNG